jgi:putative ABC transport system permease protein
VKLVGIAFVIGAPLAWYIMRRWLDDFAYQIPLDVTIFLLAGLSAAIVAIITISYESIRAASVNPVKSLRTE